jgi:hypothetical protein
MPVIPIPEKPVLCGKLVLNIAIKADEFRKMSADQEAALSDTVKRDLRVTLDALVRAAEAEFGHLGVVVTLHEDL